MVGKKEVFLSWVHQRTQEERESNSTVQPENKSGEEGDGAGSAKTKIGKPPLVQYHEGSVEVSSSGNARKIRRKKKTQRNQRKKNGI